MQNLSLYIQAALYTFAGAMHFVAPRGYVATVPPWVPNAPLMVVLSGIAEIACGLGLLFPQTRTIAAWGLILLLIAVFPANVFMATSPKFSQIPNWTLWARLPLQGLLIWWAWKFT
jgi:uncharacterized membrane protein